MTANFDDDGELRNVRRLYAELLGELDANPEYVTSPRGQKTHEIRNVQIELSDPTDVLLLGMGRKLSPKLAVAEALQLIGGFSDPQAMLTIAPQMAAYMDEKYFHGAYGDRAGYFLEHVVRKLKEDPDTRQANVTLWKNDLDLAEEGKHDYPCTVYLNFAIRNGELLMTTHMRSNDIWLGFPYDIFQFTALARTIAQYLNIPCGRYVHCVDSLHLYDRDRDAVNHLLTTSQLGRSPTILSEGVGFLGATWDMVQMRARQIFYAKAIKNMSDSEQWMWNTMAAHWDSHDTGL